jgi:hypothetical protein
MSVGEMGRGSRLCEDEPRRKTKACATAMRGLIGMAVLVSCLGFGQETSVQARGKDDPPSIEELLSGPSSSDALPDPPPSQIGIRCKQGSLSCSDPVGQGGARLFARIRRWWLPPDRTTVTTSIWLGEDTKRVTLQASRDTIMAAFRLDRTGALAEPPQMISDGVGDLRSVAAELSRAIVRGQPYDMLPTAKYQQWNNVVLRIGIVRNVGARGAN